MPLIVLFPFKLQILGQKVKVCKRTKKANGNQWFHSEPLAVFDCPEGSERCFFETSSLNAADKSECRSMWEDQADLGVVPIVGKLKKDNAIIQVRYVDKAVCECNDHIA